MVTHSSGYTVILMSSPVTFATFRNPVRISCGIRAPSILCFQTVRLNFHKNLMLQLKEAARGTSKITKKSLKIFSQMKIRLRPSSSASARIFDNILNKNNFKKLKIIVKYPSLIFCKPSLPESALVSRPCKKIIAKHLWKDINQNLAAPQIYFGSEHSPPWLQNNLLVQKNQRTIISFEHTAEISSWIDCKTTACSTTNIPYKFKLIICGFAPRTFVIFFLVTENSSGSKVKGTDEKLIIIL
ncbi:hypothetical protein Glove_117g224 [Diversispora epigaea]|uniref:Uncharacterized protein n=1 Tax=Diversispora epigaea TaxID=1348612 RepID=A0A397J9D0_9GLOM|nr:hypothetical protein Glove_117g224 [Diversispora epigaea]